MLEIVKETLNKRRSPWRPDGGMGVPPLSGLAAWYDADDISSIVHSDGSVSQWDDKSGNSKHVTQVTSINQPKTGLYTINGRNALFFDGVDSYIQRIDGMPNIATTIFVIANCFSSPPEGVVGPNFVGNKGSIAANTLHNVSFSAYNIAGQSTGYSTSWPSDANKSILYMGGWNGTTGGHRSRDGNLTPTAITGLTPGTIDAEICIGSRYNGSLGSVHYGTIGEILIYNSFLSEADRQRIEGYLMWKWKLAQNLPSAHPYRNEPPYM